MNVDKSIIFETLDETIDILKNNGYSGLPLTWVKEWIEEQDQKMKELANAK